MVCSIHTSRPELATQGGGLPPMVPRFPEARAKALVSDMLAALSYIHANGAGLFFFFFSGSLRIVFAVLGYFCACMSILPYACGEPPPLGTPSEVVLNNNLPGTHK